jgi:uncharacterized protein YdeI (BOF family)
MTDTNSFAIRGQTFEKTSIVNNINIADGWVVIVSDTIPEETSYAFTDFFVCCDKAGQFRILIDDAVVLNMNVNANSPFYITKNCAKLVGAGADAKIKFKASSDTTSASAMFGGFKI